MDKQCFKKLEMLRPEAIEPTKMPRTAIIGIVRDKTTGYLNAAPYSGGMISLNPMRFLFGVKGKDAIDAYRDADEFCVAISSKHQVDHMWTMALEVPHGINEIEIAGWHELKSQVISTPGIEECLLNLECKKAGFIQLPHPWRTIVIAEVVGVSIESSVLELDRGKVASLFPTHEAGSHPDTGLYAPSVLSGELISDPEPIKKRTYKGKKVFIKGSELYDSSNGQVLADIIFPSPAYILLTKDENGKLNFETVTGGSLQSNEPAVQIPILKTGYSFRNIKRTGEFVVAIPDRSLIEKFELLEKNMPSDFEKAGFSLSDQNMVDVQGFAECPVNMDCKMVVLEEIPGTDYVLLVGRKIGVTLDKEIAESLNPDTNPLHDRLVYANDFYSRFMYSVMDSDMKRKWGFHDKKGISVRELPSWGSRYTGGWWGPGPALSYWLIELCQSGLLTKIDYNKITAAVGLFNNGRFVSYLAEFFTEDIKKELREKLTILFHMMAWAHRDYEKWEKIHLFLETFPDEIRRHHDGPVYFEKWYDQKI